MLWTVQVLSDVYRADNDPELGSQTVSMQSLLVFIRFMLMYRKYAHFMQLLPCSVKCFYLIIINKSFVMKKKRKATEKWEFYINKSELSRDYRMIFVVLCVYGVWELQPGHIGLTFITAPDPWYMPSLYVCKDVYMCLRSSVQSVWEWKNILQPP